YAIMTQRVARGIPGLQGLTLTTAAASVLLAVPFAISPSPGPVDARTATLGFAIGALTAAPYALEFIALRRMPAATYGVLVSLDPAIAVIAGILLLGQTPQAVEIVAIALVVAASIGASRAGAADAHGSAQKGDR